MDVLQLRYLLAIAETGSLSRASAALHISQPSLTLRMNQLERELGVRLLERGPKGARLTTAGAAFTRDAGRLVRQFDHLAATAGEPQPVRGLVAVGIPSGAAAHLAAPLVAHVRRRWPGVRLEIFESMSGYIDELFERGRMDLTVAYVEQGAERAGDVPLYAESLYLIGEPGGVAPDGDGAGGRVPVRALAGVPLVAPASHSSLRVLVERVLRDHEVEPEVIADVESLGTMVRLARAGEACALLPLSATSGPELTARLLDPEVVRHAVVRTAASPTAPAEAVEVVRAAIATLTRDLAATGAWPGIRTKEPLA